MPHSQTHSPICRRCGLQARRHDSAAFPVNWDCWHSPMTRAFDEMANTFISALTRQRSIPLLAQLISSIAVNNGGLGITRPQAIAIPSFILTMRRCLQYSIEGVWIGNTHKNVPLPSTITDLYSNWTTSESKSFQIFNHYRMDIATVCVKPGIKGDR